MGSVGRRRGAVMLTEGDDHTVIASLQDLTGEYVE